MSGYTQEEGAGFKEHFTAIKKAIEEKFPQETVELRENYTWTLLKGHVLKLTLTTRNKQTGKIIELVSHDVKIPKHVPTWITKKDLWHHTKEELDLLIKLSSNNGEKTPSKNTITMWKEILKENVRKTNHHQKQIPVSRIQ